MTRLVPTEATAQNNPNPPLPFGHSAPQQTEFQRLLAALVCVPQVVPSGDVMTLSPDPDSATAHKRPNSGAQHTDTQSLSTEVTIDVQLIPFEDVITLSPDPVFDTATNKFNCGDQQMSVQ
jgi:hypothetical protein